MSRFATGVIVLSVGGADLHGMTANAFTSVSLKPPTVLCCVAHDAVMRGALLSQSRFAVSVLADGQEGLGRYFADKECPWDAEQFQGIDWAPGPFSEAPLLRGALAWLECELTDVHESGDHSIFIGGVVGASTGPGEAGLLFFDRGFQRTAAVRQL